MSMLMSLKENDLLNSVLNLDAIHNSLLDAMAMYNTYRTALTDRLGGELAGSGQAAKSLTIDEAAALLLKSTELDGLLNDIRGRVKRDYDEIRQIMTIAHQVLNKRLDLGIKLDMKAAPEAL
jgi:hypothetical protein